MAKILILSGKSGHGKDTLANFFSECARKDSKKVMIIHYGDLVKYFCKEYYNWNGEKDIVGRSLLQHLGTDVVRKYDESYWTRCVAEFCAAVQDEWDYILIPDARFVNEIELTKFFLPQAQVVRIIRFQDGEEYRNPFLTQAQHQHPSETSLDNYHGFDYVIKNFNNDLSFVQEQAKKLYKEI